MNTSDKVIKKKMIHRRFTEEEDDKLRELVKKYGENQWLLISSCMGTRNSRQCKDRWHQYLSPEANLAPWTQEEEELLKRLFEQYQGKWLEILKFFPKRSYNQIKNKWKTIERKRKIAEANKFIYPIKSLKIQNKLYFIKTVLPVLETMNTNQPTTVNESNYDPFDQADFNFDEFEDPCLWT